MSNSNTHAVIIIINGCSCECHNAHEAADILDVSSSTIARAINKGLAIEGIAYVDRLVKPNREMSQREKKINEEHAECIRVEVLKARKS